MEGLVACREMPEHFRVRDEILMRPSHTAIQGRFSGYGRAGIGRSFWKDFNTGRHEKAPIRWTSSRLAALHGRGGAESLMPTTIINGMC